MPLFIQPPLLHFPRTALSHLFVSASKKTIGACKNPLGCDGVLQASKQYGSTAVTCGKCSHAFCSECEFPPHSPVSCLLMKRWHDQRGYVELSKEEMEALELMYSITKPCPKCGVRIEKNQGASFNPRYLSSCSPTLLPASPCLRGWCVRMVCPLFAHTCLPFCSVRIV